MLYPDLLKTVIKHGVEIGNTIELMNLQLTVPKKCIYDFPGARDLEKIKKYMYIELAWYFSGERASDFIKKHASLWGEILNPDNTLNSNYGYLVFYNKTTHPSGEKIKTLPPFEWALKSMEQDKNSRRGIVTYNTGGFNFLENKDYICSQHQAFYIRDNTLLCYIALRSSDAIYGLPFNMVWWQVVYQQMLLLLRRTYTNLKESDILVTIYSSHIYHKHIELVKNMNKVDSFSYELKLRNPIPLRNSLDWYLEHIKNYITIK